MTASEYLDLFWDFVEIHWEAYYAHNVRVLSEDFSLGNDPDLAAAVTTLAINFNLPDEFCDPSFLADALAAFQLTYPEVQFRSMITSKAN